MYNKDENERTDFPYIIWVTLCKIYYSILGGGASIIIMDPSSFSAILSSTSIHMQNMKVI